LLMEWFRRLIFGRFYRADKSMSQAATAYKQYQRSHQLPDLERTIQAYRNALDNTNPKHGRYTTILINLAVALTELGELPGRATADIDHRYKDPIDLLGRARTFMEAKPRSERPQTYPTVLNNLGRLYSHRYRETKADEDLRASIEAYERFRSLNPPGSLPYCTSLIEHAAALWTSCELQPTTDNVDRLERALVYLYEAHQGGHRELEGVCYKHLAAVHDLLCQENRSKDSKKAKKHLDFAIRFNQSCVRLFRMSADPALSSTLVNLARQHLARYADSTRRDEDDLKNAEMNYQEAKGLMEKENGSRELREEIDRLASVIKHYKETATFSADQYH